MYGSVESRHRMASGDLAFAIKLTHADGWTHMHINVRLHNIIIIFIIYDNNFSTTYLNSLFFPVC